MPYLTAIRDNLAQLGEFLAHVATVKGDLSNITAPPRFLSPKSAIEIPSAWASRHALFLAPATEPVPVKRALSVTLNFLCSLRNVVDDDSGNAAKMPLNPFLGELHIGSFDSEDGTSTKLVTEQVSQHPPVTACHMHNKEHGIVSNGFAASETSFHPANGVTVKQAGYALINIKRFDETHLMTFPTLHIRGLATGRPYPDLGGSCYISSSSGFVTKIDFDVGARLGLWGTNQVQATLYKSSEPSDAIFHISGQWNRTLTVTDAHGAVVDEFHVDDNPTTELTVPPFEHQSSWESRRAWHKVSQGIREGDIKQIVKHKTALEERQRARREQERQEGTKWQPSFFSSLSNDGEARRLLEAIPDDEFRHFDSSRTVGLWRFNNTDDAERLITRLRQPQSEEPGN